MIFRKTIARLLIAALVLPIALCVIWGVGHLLSAMGDAQWAHVLFRSCLIGGIVWLVDLICLLVALAVHVLVRESDSAPSERQEP